MPEHDDHQDAFDELLDHNERVRTGRPQAGPARRSRLAVPAGILLVLGGVAAALWATGALDNQVTTPEAYVDHSTAASTLQTTASSGTTVGSTASATTTTEAPTTSTTVEETTTARTTTLAAVDAPGGSTQLQLTIPDQAQGAASLTLHAVRGDSWVEVRAGSGTGRVLQTGTMTKGSSSTVQGARLWVRFGNVGNLDLLVNGKPAYTKQLGTTTVVVTPAGLQG